MEAPIPQIDVWILPGPEIASLSFFLFGLVRVLNVGVLRGDAVRLRSQRLVLYCPFC